MNRMRISFTEQRGEIKGKVDIEGDGTFALEGLAQVVHTLATRHELSVDEVMQDLYAIVKGAVT